MNDAERMVLAKNVYRWTIRRLEVIARIQVMPERKRQEDNIVFTGCLHLRRVASLCRGQNRRQRVYRKIRTIKAQPWNN